MGFAPPDVQPSSQRYCCVLLLSASIRVLDLHMHSTSLRTVPEVPGRSDEPLWGAGGPPHAHTGNVEKQVVGVPAHLRTIGGGAVGVVSSRHQVSQGRLITDTMRLIYSSPPPPTCTDFLGQPLSAGHQWKGLVNAMSGLLCASLNFIESTATYQPLHSFKPWGSHCWWV